MKNRYLKQEIYLGRRIQNKLKNSKIVIVGLGALGSAAAELLTRAGIGELTLIDRDIVELDNLQRQTLYTESDIGYPKVLQAKKHLKKIDSKVKLKTFFLDLDDENVSLLSGDLILDCTDNFETRFLLNEFSLKNKIPWVHSAVMGDKGNVVVFTPGNFCFRCVFKEGEGLQTCETAGILNTVVWAVASIQVTQAIKVLGKMDYSKELLRFNIWENNFEKIKIKKYSNCPTCKGEYEYLNGMKINKIIRFCQTGNFQIRGKFNLDDVKKKFKNYQDFGYGIRFSGITLFNDGRALIKAKDIKQAKSIYSKYIGN